jgi:hypothetical protein
MIATGERFRRAQASRLAGSGADIRSLLNERRDVLSDMSRRAAAILQKSSGASPAGVMHRVTASLEALSAYGTLPSAPRAGRLVDDVDPPGFDTLAALVPRVGESAPVTASRRVLAFQKTQPSPGVSRKARGSEDERREQRRARLAAAKAATVDAAREVVTAKKVAQQSQSTLKKAATRAKDTEKEMVAAEARLQQVAELAHETRQRARRAAVEAESAAQAVEEAERTLARTRAELAKLQSE